MAAGKFHFYNTAVKLIADGTISLAGNITAVPLTEGYTPSTASDSAYGNFSTQHSTASATIVATITLANVRVTGSGANSVKWMADDISGFSRSGETIPSMKYCALLAADSATAAAPAIGFINLNTGGSVGESTQVNITWPSGVIADLVGNP